MSAVHWGSAYEIVWETDGEDVDLPTEVPVPLHLNTWEVADYLSDRFGFLVLSFMHEAC